MHALVFYLQEKQYPLGITPERPSPRNTFMIRPPATRGALLFARFESSPAETPDQSTSTFDPEQPALECSPSTSMLLE